MFGLILVFVCVVAGSIAQFTMKTGMNQIGEITSLAKLFNLDVLHSIFKNPFVLIGILIYALVAILWLGSLSTLNVSLAYPLMSLAYVGTAILAFVFLGENITLVRWMGICLVVAGCFLIIRTG